MSRQPDIEIYVRSGTVEELRDWLAKRLGPLTAEPSRGAMAKFVLQLDEVQIPVRITTGAVGKAWTSVWLDSPDTPWADDLACARDCCAHLGKEVRCAAGTWREGDDEDPDAFMQVTPEGEKAISWKTG
ncbi:MAG: hypothetical protein ACOY3X_02940 [Pseudomonadota bacterium]